MALEDLFDDIGGFSWFQVIMIAAVYSMKFMIAWSMMQMSFAGRIPDYHCVTDYDRNQSGAGMSHQSNMAVQSQQYGNDTMNVCSVNGTDCSGYVFMGSIRTAVSEWDLVCDQKWIKPTITSVQMAGVLVGALLGGQCGDYFGRKKTTYGWYLMHALFNLVAAFSVSWQMFIALRFFIGMGIGAMLVMVIPYPTEFLTLKWRILIPVFPMWALGTGFFAGAAWLLEDWSHLHLACAAFCAPGLLGYVYIPESVRWLAVQGRLKEAHDVIEKMAHVNRKPVPSYTMDALQQIAADEKKSRENGKNYSYIDIIRGKRVFLTTVIFAFHWAALSIIYYGLSFGVSSFAGNIYLNIFLMGIVDIPGAIATFFIANKVGRRLTCLGFFALGCAASFGCLVAHLKAPEDGRGAIISGLSLTAKLGVGACWVASQIWVCESYPTVTRNLGYGAANTAARIGGILAPFAVNLDEMVVFSYTLIGVLQFICLLLTFLVPETRDSVLPESLDSQGRDNKIKSETGLRVSKDGVMDTKQQEACTKNHGVKDQTMTKSNQPDNDGKVADKFNTRL